MQMNWDYVTSDVSVCLPLRLHLQKICILQHNGVTDTVLCHTRLILMEPGAPVIIRGG